MCHMVEGMRWPDLEQFLSCQLVWFLSCQLAWISQALLEHRRSKLAYSFVCNCNTEFANIT